MTANPEDLKKWIQANLVTAAVNELDIHKETVARLLVLTPGGAVIPQIDRKQLDLPGEVLLQLLGRAYAAAAGLAESDSVSSEELASNLSKGSPGGIRWALSMLSRSHIIQVVERGRYRLTPSRVGAAIERIQAAGRKRGGKSAGPSDLEFR